MDSWILALTIVIGLHIILNIELITAAINGFPKTTKYEMEFINASIDGVPFNQFLPLEFITSPEARDKTKSGTRYLFDFKPGSKIDEDVTLLSKFFGDYDSKTGKFTRDYVVLRIPVYYTPEGDENQKPINEILKHRTIENPIKNQYQICIFGFDFNMPYIEYIEQKWMVYGGEIYTNKEDGHKFIAEITPRDPEVETTNELLKKHSQEKDVMIENRDSIINQRDTRINKLLDRIDKIINEKSNTNGMTREELLKIMRDERSGIPQMM